MNKLDSSHETNIKLGLYKKYTDLGPYIDRFEPSVITNIYKEIKAGRNFFPNLGIFFNEFSLFYIINLYGSNSKK